jgi:tetratricopeptide (TPR) repeat protein
MVLRLIINEEATQLNAKGIELGRVGKFEESIEYFDKAVKIEPAFSRARYNKGLSLSKMGKFEDALSCYRKALEDDPKYSEAWYNKARLEEQLGHSKEAAKSFKGFLDLAPLDWVDEIDYAKKAIQNIEKNADLDPHQVNSESGDSSTWILKGNESYSSRLYLEALANYEKAIETNPSSFEAWTNKALALSSLGRFNEAITSAEKAIAINPGFADAWVFKGSVLDTCGRSMQAIECYDKAIEINPRSANAWNNKGTCLVHLNRMIDAIGCYDKALEIDPLFLGALNNKAWTEGQSNLPDNAIRSFKKLFELILDHPISAEQIINIQASRQRLQELERIESAKGERLMVALKLAEYFLTGTSDQDKIIKDLKSQNIDVLEMSITMLEKRDEGTRRNLIDFWGKLGDKRAIPLLRKIYEVDGSNECIRSAIIKALHVLGDHDRLPEPNKGQSQKKSGWGFLKK